MGGVGGVDGSTGDSPGSSPHSAHSPLIIAHRGASGAEYENSRAAFRRAGKLGADGIELDVHSTRDGILLVHHDPELPGLGPIGQLGYPEAREFHLPNGETVPTLPEALEIAGSLRVYIEVKTLPPEHDSRLLAATAQGPNPGGYAIHSFDHRIIARLGQQGGPPRGILLSAYCLDPVRLLQDAGASMLWQSFQLIDQSLVSAVHGIGASVIAWTVSAPEDARRLAGLGVDGLCGNYPDRLRAGLSEGT